MTTPSSNAVILMRPFLLPEGKRAVLTACARQNVDFPLFAVFCGFAVEHLWLTVIRGDGETQFSAFYGHGSVRGIPLRSGCLSGSFGIRIPLFHLTQVDGFPGMSQTVDDGMLTCHGIMFRAVPQL
mgnify:CR=1 FL=1